VWAGAADGSLSVCLDASGAGQLDPAGWRVFKPEGGMKGEPHTSESSCDVLARIMLTAACFLLNKSCSCSM
jgi:hypothetical protein